MVLGDVDNCRPTNVQLKIACVRYALVKRLEYLKGENCQHRTKCLVASSWFMAPENANIFQVLEPGVIL
jgi:hypothetical protein